MRRTRVRRSRLPSFMLITPYGTVSSNTKPPFVAEEPVLNDHPADDQAWAPSSIVTSMTMPDDPG